MDELEKVELIRERVEVTYGEAHAALQEADGDVVQALIYLENKRRTLGGRLQGNAARLWRIINEAWEKGSINRIAIKKGEKAILEIPVTAGVAGVLLMLMSPAVAAVSAISAVAAMASDYKLEVVRPGGEREVYPLQEETS
ncbi:MAG: DUF4342 domain-containing protein [Clostridia bacterium]|nr:MAG: DUF4342 domain-containing protein [Clostridia bacterium]